MTAIGPGKRLSVYVGESDSWRGRSLYISILETLRDNGIAGATVTRGLAGYGAHSRLRLSTIETLSMDMPIMITVVDTPEAIQKALALVKPMVREGLITLEDVEIIKYSHRYLQPLPADRLISEIMTREVVTVTPETPAIQVVQLLLGKLFKAVPVIDSERRVVGIITDTDLIREAGMPTRMAVGERLTDDDLHGFLSQVSQDKTAAQIMTHPVQTVKADEALGHVVQTLVQHKLKRLPVIDSEGHLAGIVSRLDVLRAVGGGVAGEQERAPMPRAGRTIAELMTPKVPMVDSNDDLVDVLQQMLQADIKRVVVVDDAQRPIGIITDGDLVARVGTVARPSILRALAAKVLGGEVQRGSVLAKDVMSERVLSAPGETSVVDAISLMLRESRKRLVVIDTEGRPIGLVDRQTLMAATLGI